MGVSEQDVMIYSGLSLTVNAGYITLKQEKALSEKMCFSLIGKKVSLLLAFCPLTLLLHDSVSSFYSLFY